jgi:hypothetical protein
MQKSARDYSANRGAPTEEGADGEDETRAVEEAAEHTEAGGEGPAPPATNANERHALPAANANEKHALPATTAKAGQALSSKSSKVADATHPTAGTEQERAAEALSPSPVRPAARRQALPRQGTLAYGSGGGLPLRPVPLRYDALWRAHVQVDGEAPLSPPPLSYAGGCPAAPRTTSASPRQLTPLAQSPGHRVGGS